MTTGVPADISFANRTMSAFRIRPAPVRDRSRDQVWPIHASVNTSALAMRDRPQASAVDPEAFKTCSRPHNGV